MESFTWIGFGVFFFASLFVGVRLLLLWSRTRGLPELLVGIGVLGIGPVGFGLMTVAELSRGSAPALSRVLLGIALLAVSAGVFAQCCFNWRVYHPGQVWVRRIVWVGGASLVALYLADFRSSGFEGRGLLGPNQMGRNVLQVGCLLWGAGEALRYWRMMRRRLRLGLADAVVTNRFFLWGLAAGAAGVGSGIGVVVQLTTSAAPIQVPWLMLSSSLHGLTAAVAMWLAFVPSEAYKRFIETRARAHLAA
jgi:hypothetical protein